MSTPAHNLTDFNRTDAAPEREFDPAFPVHALPSVLQTPINELTRVPGCPSSLPAACVLAMISAALGKKLWLKHPIYPGTPANLYILGVTPSGQHKTTIFEHLWWSLRDKEQQILAEFHRHTLRGY